MKKLLLPLILLITAHIATAQILTSPAYKDYQWAESPEVSVLSEAETKYPAVILASRKIIEYRQPLYGMIETLYTEHQLTHINSDAGLESNNKIFIPLTSGKTLLDLQVRAISPTGKVTLIQRENIKQLENVNGYKNVKIFAIEGLEINGEAEYIYTITGPLEPYGKEILQNQIPIREAQVNLIYPKKWAFETKSYNGLSKATFSLESGKNEYVVMEKDIPAFQDDEYSYGTNDLKRFEYKITSNGYEKNLFTWEYLSSKLIANLNTKKGLRIATKYIKGLTNESMSTEEKIRALEQKIKSNITIQNGTNPALSEPASIIKNGVGNDRGLFKLYLYCLKAMNIRNEILFCSNRYRGVIDPEFANVSGISDGLIYFPEYQKYLVPGAIEMRYGAAPSFLASSTGLFVSYYIDINSFKYIKHSFDVIKPWEVSLNKQGVKVTIDLSSNITNPAIDQENYSMGYRAFSDRAAYYYSDEAGKENYLRATTLSSFENFNIIERSVEGHALAKSAEDSSYFQVFTKYTTPELVEQVGTDYLISIGKIIGKQSELYQETERTSDIAFHSISNYLHKLKIILPDGYKLTGTESLKIDNRVSEGGKDVMYFISNYEINANVLEITIQEVYKVLGLPAKQYPQFRKVINSAADFNKAVIVLSPE